MPKMIDPFLLDNGEKYPYSASMFPIKNEKHLLLVEEKLDKDLRYKHFLIDELYEVKSDTLVNLVKKIMTQLFDDNVLLGYGVLGNRKSSTKKDFLELNICGVVFSAIMSRSRYEGSYEEIERKIKAHLSQSSYRVFRQSS